MSARRPHGQSSNTSPTPAPAPGASDVSPAVPSDVIYKLLFFTAAMVIGPIGIYFLTVNAIFSGNSTYAGILAAVTANVVLFAYIYVAWLEDQGEQGVDKSQSKKSQ